MLHKLEIYCYSEEDFNMLLRKLYDIAQSSKYDLIKWKERNNAVLHHHFDFKKKEEMIIPNSDTMIEETISSKESEKIEIKDKSELKKTNFHKYYFK